MTADDDAAREEAEALAEGEFWQAHEDASADSDAKAAAAEAEYREDKAAAPAFVPVSVPEPSNEQAAYLAVVEGLVPATAGQVAAALGKLGSRLQELTNALAVADEDATRLDEKYQLAYNRAFLVAGDDVEGRVTEAMRKAHALVDTHQQRLDMEVAKLAVRSLRQAVKTLDRRIDTGRTMAATVRAEAGLTATGGRT